MQTLKKNQTFTAEVEGLNSLAQGVCRVDGRAVFLPGAIPGEIWEAKILKANETAAYARGERLVRPSPDRAAPGCPLYGRCGGCSTMHMSYERELAFKLDKVNGAIRRIGGLDFSVGGIIGAESRYSYRNKAIYAVGDGVCGFFRPRSHDIIPVSRCLIQQPCADALSGALTGWMRREGIPAYDEATGRGSVRHLFVRTAQDGRAVACVVSARGFGAATPTLAPALRGACPELAGVVLNINKTRGNTVLAGDFYTLDGSEILTDRLCGLEFALSPQSFFQINPPQAERLYELAVEYAAPDGGLVLDLYCGTGTISLCLARRAGRVIGAEIVEPAVVNARLNAARNGIGNAEFICADAGQAAEELLRRGERPDAVVVDPPRRGLAAGVIDCICGMGPRRVVYVSCDCATLARDMALFARRGWTPARGMAVDMFPCTHHVETIVLLQRGTL